MLECVINISEGIDSNLISLIGKSCTSSLLDIHSDPFHNRSVFTLAGPNVETDARSLATVAIENLDIRKHQGVHPRIGVVDVVPFVPLFESTMQDAVRAQDEFSKWLARTHQVPAFKYGIEPTLPFVRKHAFNDLYPDYGPSQPHLTAGAVAVGARNVLVAYNLWLETTDASLCRKLAQELRNPEIRVLGLEVGGHAQISCNLIAPTRTGPQEIYEQVANRTEIDHAELVGLIPMEILKKQDNKKWSELGISEAQTIESRLKSKGLYA